jgi:hypothetical protein
MGKGYLDLTDCGPALANRRNVDRNRPKGVALTTIVPRERKKATTLPGRMRGHQF